MKDTDTAPGPHTGDMSWAGLSMHLATGPELPLALLCASAHMRWALVRGLATALPCAHAGQGDVGLALAGSPPPGGWEGTRWCSYKARDLCCLLVKGCFAWVQGSGREVSCTQHDRLTCSHLLWRCSQGCGPAPAPLSIATHTPQHPFFCCHIPAKLVPRDAERPM